MKKCSCSLSSEQSKLFTRGRILFEQTRHGADRTCSQKPKPNKNIMTPADNNNSNLTNGFSHVGLSVSDLDASLQFFQALGFNKVGGVESYPSFFLSDGASLLTIWQTDADAVPFDRRKNVGLHHLAIKVTSRQALDDAYAAVSKVQGVRLDGEGAFQPEELKGTPLTHAMVFEPSGNRIELTYHAE
jgi:lactoylglutathione lyase